MNGFALLALAAFALGDGQGTPLGLHSGVQADEGPGDPEVTYWLYVLAESPDYIHRIRYGPEGAQVDATIEIADLYRQSEKGDLLSDHEDPHGVRADPTGRYVFVTTGHGLPYGKMWKIEAETGQLSAGPVILGRFPASLDVSPDGLYAMAVNFNLHGAMAPSTVSAVFAPSMAEIARVEVCTMPHGSRFHPSGRFHYSVCMMDDQLVEIDTRTFAVSRRFFLGQGEEGLLEPDDLGFHADLDVADAEAEQHKPRVHHDHPDPEQRRLRRSRLPHEHAYHPSCSPTWVQPGHSGSRIYVACNASDEVLEISFDEWELTRRFPTGRGPYNVDVTSDDQMLIVTLKQGDGVEFIDLESGESLRRADTSTRVVHGVTISPDDRYAFISVEGIGAEPGKVDIFDLKTLEMVDSVEVGQMASGIAFWKIER